MLTVVMFGIIGVLILGYFAKTLFAQKEKPVANTLREVPMAVTDIRPGTVITADHLGVGRYDRNKLTPDVLLANRVIVGRVAREPIKAATPIRSGQLYQPGELPPLDIGPGMRAVSVEVGDGVAMVDGIIKPGDTVDVLFTAQGGNASNDSTYQGGLTMRLFEGVKVLAINRNFSQGRVDRGNNHVTLELTVAQTNIVVLAKDRGKITLTYNPNGRGNGGLALSNAERVTLFELLGLQKADPILEPFRTQIYRGSGRIIVNRFDAKGRRIDDTRNQQAPGQNNQYVLPNNDTSGTSGGNSKSADAPADNVNPKTVDQPQLEVVPSRDASAPLPLLNGQRSAPTAQLPQPRSSL
jgi:pilus assembly protein CpaB